MLSLFSRAVSLLMRVVVPRTSDCMSGTVLPLERLDQPGVSLRLHNRQTLAHSQSTRFSTHVCEERGAQAASLCVAVAWCDVGDAPGHTRMKPRAHTHTQMHAPRRSSEGRADSMMSAPPRKKWKEVVGQQKVGSMIRLVLLYRSIALSLSVPLSFFSFHAYSHVPR